MTDRRPTNDAPGAPAAIGPYSQAMASGNLVFLSGQIPLVPETGEMVEGGFDEQTRQVFSNLEAVCKAAGGGLDSILKLNVYMLDLGNFARFNEIASERLNEPYPARAAIGVASLPKGSLVEIEAVMAAGG